MLQLILANVATCCKFEINCCTIFNDKANQVTIYQIKIKKILANLYELLLDLM